MSIGSSATLNELENLRSLRQRDCLEPLNDYGAVEIA